MVMRRRRSPQPEAGGPVTCRRKLDLPPPVDRISNLSNDLLRKIILLLPTKDGGRTQALASRWRHLWRSAPLDLDCCSLDLSDMHGFYRRSHVSAVVSRILSVHPGPVRRLCARNNHLYGNMDDDLLLSGALDNLEELEFIGLARRLPTPIFRFSDTLLVVSIVDCNLPDDIVRGLNFPRLKQLGLERVSVSELSLHGLISRCPVLEFLLVHSSSGFYRLRINSPSLTRLCVRINPNAYAEIDFDEIVIENAPRLQRLIHLYSVCGLDLCVYHAPKVETLDVLANLRNFARRLGRSSRSTQDSPCNYSTTAAHVRCLSINMDILNLDRVVDLMRLFPCLEKLHVKSDMSNAKSWWRQNWWRRKHRNFIRSHDIRVNTLVLEPYLHTLSHINFVTFFVLNAKELELMTFQIRAGVYSEEFLTDQHRKLQLDNKASRSARCHFITTSCNLAVPSTKHIRDYFDLNDPFLGGC